MKKWSVLWLLLVVGCQVNEADEPGLSTDEALQIGSTSVLMGAAITEIGPVRPQNFGILYDTQSTVNMLAATKVVLGETSGPRAFSIRVDNLTPNTTYYYRGFAANGDYSKVEYGGIVSFTTLP